MKEIEVEIPLYRAKLLNGEYMIGLLMGIDKEDNLCSIREIDSETVGGHIGYLDTLSISISDMIDSNGKRIFASLNKSGSGGSITETKDGYKVYNRVHLFFKDGTRGSKDLDVVDILSKKYNSVLDIKIKGIKE